MMEALYLMGGLGIVVGIGLAAASKIFYVYVDPKILAVDDALPGANCGGCSLPGCAANAEAIVAGEALPNSCVAGGPEIAEAIAGILGVAIEIKEPDIALPGCTYGVKDADIKYIYGGLNDCKAAALLSGGMKVCNIGCIGLGTCEKACPFNAISMGPEGLPVVNEKSCTGCGTCERVCPKQIITLSSVTRRIIREYTTQDCTTPCQRTCPAGIDICQYIKKISSGDYYGAVQTIKERNPFPAVIGRICPRPCESECRRQYVDEPVAINALKRYAADFEKQSNQRIFPYKAPDTGRKIAVIGGGIEGLATAFFSARLGHELTVFEATPRLGGLLRTAIARYRLPEEILDWDIEGILEMGVTAETGKMMGKDFTIDSLLGKEYEAVFLAAGGWDSRLTRGSNANVEKPIPGTFLLIDLVKTGTENKNQINCGSDVVISGGGKLAVHGVALCKGLGAKNITVLFRETEDQLSIEAADIQKMKDEGAQVVFGAGIVRFLGEDSKLTEIEYAMLNTSESDIPEKQMITADTLFLASGRFPEMIFVKQETKDLESDEPVEPIEPIDGLIRWQGVEPYKQPAYRNETGLLAEGDALTDFSGAIRAIGAGRRTAATIHQMMYGIDISLPENVITPISDIQDVDYLEDVKSSKRGIMPFANTQEVSAGKELEKGFTQDMARAEADRCLQCGLICYKHTREQLQKIELQATIDDIQITEDSRIPPDEEEILAEPYSIVNHGRIN